MTRYLQKLFGYCLLGNPVEEKLFVLYGPSTRNGKSTLLNVIASVFGDYCRFVLPESLAESRFTDGSKANSDIARLAGVRLAGVNEPPEGLELNAAKVKAITGRDKITARFLHKEFFDFTPQFVIVINTNYAPDITDITLFSSGRVVIIPFKKHFEEHEQDKNLKNELLAPEALSGVLNWVLDGLKLYKDEGLEPCDAIKNEIANYQHESDTLARFIEECVEVTSKKGVYTLISNFYNLYARWCFDNGCHAQKQKGFRYALEAKGFQIERQKDGNRVLGVEMDYGNSFGYIPV